MYTLGPVPIGLTEGKKGVEKEREREKEGEDYVARVGGIE